jgi:Signal transduction histidine kinase
VLSLALVTLTVLGAFVAVVFLLFRDRLRSELDDSLKTFATEVIAAVEAGSPIPQPPIESGQLGAAILSPDGRVIDSTLTFEGELEPEQSGDGSGDGGGESSGEVSSGSGRENEVTELSTVDALLEAATSNGTLMELPGEHGTELRAFVRRIEADGAPVVVATLAPSSSSGSPANRLLVISLIALTSAVLVVVVIAYWVGGLAVRPLRHLATEVHSLDERSLDERVDVPGHAVEVAEVAAAVNTLLSRIDQSLQRERAFVADASHELRNPLASLRAELELSSRDADPDRMRLGIQGAIEETDRLARLADDLLLLARADAGNLKIEPISLADVTSTAIVRQAKRAAAGGVSLDLMGDDVTALGAPGLVGRALDNLIENALRYAPNGTAVQFTLWSDGSSAGIDVRDRGSGISSEERERIFDRFARVDPSRARDGGGTGLGLAIVASAMHAMGGSVQLISAEPGNTVFRLAFSRAAES